MCITQMPANHAKITTGRIFLAFIVAFVLQTSAVGYVGQMWRAGVQ
jgi:hypothetical protein